MPPTHTSESALVERARRGEAEAIAGLYRLHAPAIFRYFYLRLPARSTAEDLTGEVFVKMVEALPRYEERGYPITAWLFRMAHDRMVDYHRRAAHGQTEPLSDTLEAQEAGTETQAMDGVERQRLHANLRTLSNEQQVVVQLRFIEGYGLEECAQILGKTTGAIKSLQHRALRQLGRKLDR